MSHSKKPAVEVAFERGLFASRWLAAPFYLGLVVALVMLLIVFVNELIHEVSGVMTMSAD